MKKVVVCGPYNAGKTTFVRNVNRQEFLGTDEPEIDVISLKESGTTTTVGVEVNFLKDSGKEVMFIGVPGQPRFDFIWEVVGGRFDALLFLIPSFVTLKDAKFYVDFFSGFDSYRDALKLLVVTYPQKADESKLFAFKSLGLPVRVLDPTDEEAVISLAREVVSKL